VARFIPEASNILGVGGRAETSGEFEELLLSAVDETDIFMFTALVFGERHTAEAALPELQKSPTPAAASRQRPFGRIRYGARTLPRAET
jgi:hypothetical protein